MLKVKQLKDVNQLAKHIVDLATGNAGKTEELKQKPAKKPGKPVKK